MSDSPPRTASAIPKSATSACPAPSRMFSGFTSRCTTPSACAKASASAASRAIATASSTGSRRSRSIRCAQALALDVGHGEPEQAVGAGAAVEHGEDVGMLQPGGEADLALEPLEAEGGGEAGVEDLERDGTVVAEVVGQPDGGHPAPADGAIQPVPAGQCLAQAFRLAQAGAPGIRCGDGHQGRKSKHPARAAPCPRRERPSMLRTSESFARAFPPSLSGGKTGAAPLDPRCRYRGRALPRGTARLSRAPRGRRSPDS